MNGTKNDITKVVVEMDAAGLKSGAAAGVQAMGSLEDAIKRVQRELDTLAKANRGVAVKARVTKDTPGYESLAEGVSISAEMRQPTPQEQEVRRRQRDIKDRLAESKNATRRRRYASTIGYIDSVLDRAGTSGVDPARGALRMQQASLKFRMRSSKMDDPELKDAVSEAKKAAQAVEADLNKTDRQLVAEREKNARDLDKASKRLLELERKGGGSVLTAAGRYGTMRTLHTGIVGAGAGIGNLIAGGAEGLGGNMLSMLSTVGRVIHMAGLKQYTVGAAKEAHEARLAEARAEVARLGGGAGGGGTGAAGSGGPAAPGGGGGGGGPGIGTLATAGRVAGALGGSSGMGTALLGSGIMAAAALAIPLYKKGVANRQTSDQYADDFDKSFLMRSGFNTGGAHGESTSWGNLFGNSSSGKPGDMSSDFFTYRTRDEAASLSETRRSMYNYAATYGMSRGEVNEQMGALQGGIGISFDAYQEKKGRGRGTYSAQQTGDSIANNLVVGKYLGVSGGTMGRYFGESMSTLIGQQRGNPMTAMGSEVLAAQRWGLNPDQYLQGSMSLRSGAAAQGISATQDSMGAFGKTLNSAGVDRNQTFNAQQALIGSTAGAANMLTGGYAGIGDPAILSYALRKTGNYEDAVDYMRGMSQQERLEAIKGTMGSTAAKRYLMSTGMSKDAAGNVLSGKAASGADDSPLSFFSKGNFAREIPQDMKDAANQEYESTLARKERTAKMDRFMDQVTNGFERVVDSITKLLPFGS